VHSDRTELKKSIRRRISLCDLFKIPLEIVCVWSQAKSVRHAITIEYIQNRRCNLYDF